MDDPERNKLHSSLAELNRITPPVREGMKLNAEEACLAKAFLSLTMAADLLAGREINEYRHAKDAAKLIRFLR